MHVNAVFIDHHLTGAANEIQDQIDPRRLAHLERSASWIDDEGVVQIIAQAAFIAHRIRAICLGNRGHGFPVKEYVKAGIFEFLFQQVSQVIGKAVPADQIDQRDAADKALSRRSRVAFDWQGSSELIWRSSSPLHHTFAMHRASIKAGPADAEIPASFAGIADHLGVLEHFKFALNVAFFVRHEYFLHPKTGRLQEVSRESVHIYPAVIEGAGGYFTDWNGNALSFDMDGRVIAAGDRARLNEASSILSYIGG